MYCRATIPTNRRKIKQQKIKKQEKGQGKVSRKYTHETAPVNFVIWHFCYHTLVLEHMKEMLCLTWQSGWSSRRRHEICFAQNLLQPWSAENRWSRRRGHSDDSDVFGWTALKESKKGKKKLPNQVCIENAHGDKMKTKCTQYFSCSCFPKIVPFSDTGFHEVLQHEHFEFP